MALLDFIERNPWLTAFVFIVTVALVDVHLANLFKVMGLRTGKKGSNTNA